MAGQEQQAYRRFIAPKHFGARMGLLQVLLDRRFRQRGGPQTD